MTIHVASGATFDPVTVPLADARSAIYAAVHNVSSRVYVGMTRESVAKRWKQHCYDVARKSRNYHFASALRKYGYDAFDVYVIECDIPDDQLKGMERLYIRRLSADMRCFGFNSTEGGDCAPSSHPEVRAKISAAQLGKRLTEEHKRKLSIAGIGRKRSPETIEKWREKRVGIKFTDSWIKALSESHKGNKPSAETKAKMSAAHKARHVATGVGKSQGEKMRALWADPAYKARVGRRIKETLAARWAKEVKTING
jgi:group I intron endonuclease